MQMLLLFMGGHDEDVPVVPENFVWQLYIFLTSDWILVELRD